MSGCDMSKIKEGEIFSPLNKKIEMLIVCAEDYVVFLDEDYYVQWWNFQPTPHHSQVLNKVAILEALSSLHVPEHEKAELMQVRRLLGEAVARSFEDDEQAAQDVLATAEKFLMDRSMQRAQMWYLSAAALAFAVVSGSGFILWMLRDHARVFLGTNAFDVLVCSCFGSMGAFLSILMRLRELNFNAAMGKNRHSMEGAARIAVGLLGAFVVAIAAKGNLCFGSLVLLKDNTVILANMAALCFVAGASERFVPNVISKMETAGDATK